MVELFTPIVYPNACTLNNSSDKLVFFPDETSIVGTHLTHQASLNFENSTSILSPKHAIDI